MSVWRDAISIIVAVLTAALATAVGVDIYIQARGRRPIGEQIQTWSRRYPLYSGMLVTLLGALLAHFFLNLGW